MKLHTYNDIILSLEEIFIGVCKYYHNWNFLETESEELYYFLGFVAADGYISNDAIEIGLNEKDKDILEVFKSFICPDKPLYYKKRTNSYTLKISCRKHIPRFKKFFNMTTNKKHKELIFPKVPKKYVKHFIREYVDGDGTLDTTKAYRGDKVYVGARSRVLGNYDFLYTLNKYTKEIYPHKTNSISKKGKEEVYIVTYNFSTAKAILEWLYKDNKICLKRKYDKFLEISNL